MVKPLIKFDFKSNDTASLQQAKQVLESVDPDFAVIDALTAIRKELKTRDPKEEEDLERFLKLDLSKLTNK